MIHQFRMFTSNLSTERSRFLQKLAANNEHGNQNKNQTHNIKMLLIYCLISYFRMFYY
jgi:hypothetical protein